MIAFRSEDWTPGPTEFPGTPPRETLEQEAQRLLSQGKARCMICHQVRGLDDQVTIAFGKGLLLAACTDCVPMGGIVLLKLSGGSFQVILREPRLLTRIIDRALDLLAPRKVQCQVVRNTERGDS